MDKKKSMFTVQKVTDGFVGLPTQKRDCYQFVRNYIVSQEKETKICALYGLRRTGKTFLMQQVAQNLPENLKGKALFITCNSGTDFYDVQAYINSSMEKGYRIFFVDEITYADGFQRIGEVLSDFYVGVKGARIVVAGTDSLGLSLISRNFMYDRIKFVHTTYTSFPEYSRLTGCLSIDDYIRYGSTLAVDVFSTHKSAMEYVEYAIVDNMLNSLDKSEGISRYKLQLTELYAENELKDTIERIINKFSQRISAKAVKRQFSSSMLSSSVDLIIRNKDNPDPGIKDFVDFNVVNAKIASSLGILPNNKVSVVISDEHIKEIFEFLKDMDVFTKISVYSSFAHGKRVKDLDIITHPGMYHANIKYTLDTLKQNTSWFPGASNDQIERVLDGCLTWAEGQILENVVLKDVSFMLCYGKQIDTSQDSFNNSARWYVSKLDWEDANDKSQHEIDMIIFDKDRKDVYLFEVKHSSQFTPEQENHLRCKSFMDYIRSDFGDIKYKAVLFLGDTDFNHAIPRIKVEDFLIGMYQDIKRNGSDYTPLVTLDSLKKRFERNQPWNPSDDGDQGY